MQKVAFRNEKGETEPDGISDSLLPEPEIAFRSIRCMTRVGEEPAAAVAETAELWYNHMFKADEIVRTIPDEK